MTRPLDRTTIDAKPPAHAALALGPGVKVEQYELIRELGKGGMGQVFLARDNKLGRRVAIKFLAAKNKQHAERFLVEARATARCSHENIVIIHEVDEHAGVPYMVLEYVEGATLSQLARDKRMATGRVVELMVPVVRALAAAHAANIVHRDLKPDNILVTQAGTVKVLDFGIASVGEGGAQSFAGTLPYMSPEQLGADTVDTRSDLWAIGIILYELLAGKHPLEPLSQGVLFAAAASADPMPSLADDAPGLPDRLVAVVARCLEKKKTARYASAHELLADLEPLLPNRRALAAEDSPYPGLTSFQESDAAKFFGRSQDVAALVAKLRERPLVGVVGPSGVGKSSLLRAGVVPALKDAGESWETMILRPGRYPLTALASVLEGLRDSRDSDPIMDADPAAKLRAEPGTFGARLRARARRRRSQILLFVDQLEELYTLVPDPAERAAFTACLTAAGDDAAGPLRVVVSMRSDFLDRAAEDRRFVEELTRGLIFLQPPNAAALEQALTQPLHLLGFSFEDGIVDAMVDALAQTPGALPLLQFSAAKLWDQRDRHRRVLTREAYVAMGGVAGALATHADEVIAKLSAADQRTARTLFQRLVTPERTRAIVETAELRDISPDIPRLVADLTEARLLTVHTRSAGAVELVHESLITSWPTLRRWLDENQDDAAYLAQVRAAAKQWDARGRAPGLLWRGEALDEARVWRSRYTGELPPREKDFLDAATQLATRATRIRRAAALATIAVLLAVIAGGAYALVQIQHNKQLAQREAAAAQKAQHDAEAQRTLAEQREQEAKQALAQEQAAQAAERLAREQKDAAVTAQTQAEKQAAAQQLAAAKSKAAADDARQRLEAKQKADAAAKKRRDANGTIDKGGL